MRMNFLVLGNGFDLAHRLETKYKNFLDWAYKNDKMSIYNGFNLYLYWCDKYKLAYNHYLVPPMKNQYKPGFEDLLFAEKDNWIDLENNIASIINPWASFFSEENKFQKSFKDVLDKFILPEFEQYIDQKINNDPIEKQYNLKHANRILCFNYSNTVERLYQPEAEICYVNGKASLNKLESHIVFGYDPIDEKQGSEFWCEYDKVHQRAYKNTDMKYKEWLKDDNTYFIHIFGHSLGQTDHAILRPFIMKENSKTIVYYHNLDSKRQLIYRMMGMVGRVNFDKGDIDFKPTSEFNMVDYNPYTAEQEIQVFY